VPAPARYPAAAACIHTKRINTGDLPSVVDAFPVHASLSSPSLSLHGTLEELRGNAHSRRREDSMFVWHRHRTAYYAHCVCIGMETGRNTKGEACLALCGAVPVRSRARIEREPFWQVAQSGRTPETEGRRRRQKKKHLHFACATSFLMITPGSTPPPALAVPPPWMRASSSSPNPK
jgi:hypothetical protein